MSIRKAIRFAFTGGETTKKIGLLFILTMILLTFSGIFTAVSEMPLQIMNEYIKEGWLGDSFKPIVGAGFVFTGLIALTINLLLIPVSFYIHGYLFTFTKGVMNSETDPLPEHDNFMDKIKMGFRRFLLDLPLSILAFILMAIIVFTFLLLLLDGFGFSTSQTPENIPVIIAAGIALFFFATLFVLFTQVLQNAIYFNYLNGEGLLRSFDPRKIFRVIGAGWKPIFKAIFASVLLALGALVLNLFLICFSFITYPLSIVLLQIITSHMFGQAYAQIKKDLG